MELLFKNTLAGKLALSFGICLLLFSIIMGSMFMYLFRSNTIDHHKKDLASRALILAESLSALDSQAEKGGFHEQGEGLEFGGGLGATGGGLGVGGNGGGGLGSGGGKNQGLKGFYGSDIRFWDKLARASIWVLDQNLQTIIRGEVSSSGKALSFDDLPDDAEAVVKQVFQGDSSVSESFSSLWDKPTITAGAPIIRDGSVVGAVLIHAPVEDANAAVAQGLYLMVISTMVALIIAFLFSLWLSKTLADPILSKEAAEAVRLDRLRKDFVANISHELKTPVAVLRGSLEALSDGVVTEPDKVQAYHREMLSETTYLERLVSDLLDLSKLQNLDFKMNVEDLNLNGLVEDTIRGMERLSRKKGA